MHGVTERDAKAAGRPASKLVLGASPNVTAKMRNRLALT